MQRMMCLIGLVCVSGLAATAATGRADLSGIDSWCYWLQEIDLDELADSTVDLAVIDYSADGSGDAEFTASEIAAVQATGKKVLAYFSIGEAEDYRFYWKSSWRVGKPGFIVAENPDWEGNYKVKFWTNGWWNKALQPYLDRILAAGYDGVQLDVVDAYWWWHEVMGVSARRSANRMAKLIRRIAEYARARAGDDFIVSTTNGASLLDDCSNTWRNNFVADIDALAAESLFFHIWSSADQAYRLEKLSELEDEGKRLFVIDYVDPSDHDLFFERIADSGVDLVGYPAAPDFELDELVVVE